MVEVDIGLNILSTCPVSVVDQELMLKGEVYIGIRTSTLPPITQVVTVYCWFYQFLLIMLTKMFMNMRVYNIVVMVMRGVM